MNNQALLSAKPQSSSIVRNAALVGAGTLLTALAAQIQIPLLPFTPVPLSLQLLAVLLCGAFLGASRGALSQALYLGLGAAGAPVFAGAAGGMAILSGATFGYLLAFPIAAGLVGLALPKVKGTLATAGVLFAATIPVLVIGALWLKIALGLSAEAALLQGIAPFIAGDVVKVALATLIVLPLRKTR